MRVKLVHIQGPLAGQIQEFTEVPVTIGRHPSCHVRFPADLTTISRNHASIVREGNRCKIVDTSTNGTFVNGKRVEKEVFLKNGDVIMFTEGGPKVSYLAELTDDIAPGRTAAPLPPGPSPHTSPHEAPGARPPKEDMPQAPTNAPSPAPQGRIPRAQAPLIVQYGPWVKTFRELPVIVGAASDADLMLSHPHLLARHAAVFFDNNTYWVRDLTGKSLVTVNGRPLAADTPLAPMDVLSLAPGGPTFKFLGEGRLAEYEEAPASEQRPSRDAPSTDSSTASPKKATRSIFDIFKR